MEVDEALGKLGTVGRWQVLYYTMISTACMVLPCFHMLAINYIGKRTRSMIYVQSFNLHSRPTVSSKFQWLHLDY